MNTYQERELSLKLSVRPELLSPDQRELALNQDACRTANQSPVACALSSRIHAKVSDLCANCQLVRSHQ